MAGYSARQSTYTTGDVITATDTNDEFNQLLSAFNASTGHTHDGTAGDGGPVGAIRDSGNLNRVLIDDSNNHLEFYVDVSSSSVQQLRIQDGAIVPITDNDIDLGTASLEFKNLYIDGTANIDSLVADTADINAGTVDAIIGGTTPAAGTFTTLTANTSLALASGATVTAINDEDTMSSDSATALATQQSIKAYVDAQVTAQDLDFQADSGGALSIDLDSETLTLTGGTGIDTSGATNTVTFAIDNTVVATLTDSQTLTNKTLTTPVISSISNTGTITLPTSTDTLVGRATTDTLTNKTLTSPVLNGTLSGTAFLDEDTMSSDSATAVASQQSIKAYVDAQVATANELSELTDVNITTPADGSLLFYDTGTSKWIDNVVSGDITIADTGVAAISSGVIVNADVNASAAIDATKIHDGSVTNTEFGYIGGLTSDAQTQLNAKLENVVEDTTPQLGGNLDTNGNNIDFGDGDRARFGASLDLQIFHDGTNSKIQENGTGQLILDSNGNGVYFTKSDSEYMAKMIADGAVELYYDNSKKFETTSGGIDVTGTAVTDGLTVAGNATITTADNSNTLTLISTDGDALAGPRISFQRQSASPANDDVLGQIFFTGKDSGGNNTDYATIRSEIMEPVDGSENGQLEFLIIKSGTQRSSMKLDRIENVFNEEGQDIDFRVESDGNTHGLFVDAGNNRVGILNSSPTVELDVTGDLKVSGSATIGGTAAKTAGKETIWVPASAMYGATTNGANPQQVETTAGRPDMKVLDFDPDIDEFAQFSVAFPKSWNEGTVTYQIFWTPSNTNTGDCKFELQAVSCGDNDTIDVAFGTAVTVIDAGLGTVNDQQVSAESAAVTIAGSPAVDQQVYFQLFRDGNAGGDTFTGDARVLGIKIFFTTDAANDA